MSCLRYEGMIRKRNDEFNSQPLSGPALGMFEVLGRTGPPILGGGGAILDPATHCNTDQRTIEMLQPDALCDDTMQQNVSARRAPDTAGELTAGLKGAASRRGGGSEGRWRKRRRGKGKGGRGNEREERGC